MSVKAIIQTFLDTSEPSCEHRDKGLGGGFASVGRALPSPAVHAGVFPGSSPRGGVQACQPLLRMQFKGASSPQVWGTAQRWSCYSLPFSIS